MNRPPASFTFSASGASSFLNPASLSLNIFLASTISSGISRDGPVAARICSSLYPFFLSSFLARNSGFPPSMISVPRPAILVEIVTAPYFPACAMISASFSWYLAFNTLCFMPSFLSIAESCSDFSTEMVPTRTGCPFALQSLIC